jgi:hypothetical protein
LEKRSFFTSFTRFTSEPSTFQAVKSGYSGAGLGLVKRLKIRGRVNELKDGTTPDRVFLGVPTNDTAPVLETGFLLFNFLLKKFLNGFRLKIS